MRALICASTPEVERGFERLFGGSDQLKIVGCATTGGECLAMLRKLRPDVVAIDGEVDGCEGMRLAGVLAKEQRIAVLAVIDPRREQEVRAEADARGVPLLDAMPRALLLEEVESPARTLLRQRLRGVQDEVELPAAKQPVREVERSNFVDVRVARSGIRPEVRSLADTTFDAVACIGSAGTPHLLPSLLAEVPQAQLPIVLAVHHNPRLSETFLGWIEQLVEQPVAVYHGSLAVDARFIVVPAEETSHATPTESNQIEVAPDLDEVLHSLLDSPARLLVMVTSGMGMQGLDALRRARRMHGKVAVLDPSECTYPTMPQAVIADGLADVVVTSREFAWLMANARGHQTHALAS